MWKRRIRCSFRLCKHCFIEFFQKRVKNTVEEYRMFKADNEVCIAVSGGKDSAALLHSLKHTFPEVKIRAIHVNLGIKEYSSHCLEKVKELTKNLDIELHVVNLTSNKGFSIDDFNHTIYKRKICSVCGIIKRHILDEVVKELKCKVLATGHNLDDVVGTMLVTFFAGEFQQLVRLKPVLPPLDEHQAWKVKPLIKTPELENLLYSSFLNLPFRELSCPHSRGSHSIRSKEMIEALSKVNVGFRYQALSLFTRKLIPILESSIEKQELRRCEICNMPSSAKICAYCRRVSLVKQAKSRLLSTK